MPSFDATLAYGDSDHAFGSFDRVAVGIWRGLTTPAGTKDVEREIRALAAARPLPLALSTIVQPGIPMPPADTRTELSRLLNESSDALAAPAVVLETEGLFAAAARSVGIGLTAPTRGFRAQGLRFARTRSLAGLRRRCAKRACPAALRQPNGSPGCAQWARGSADAQF